MNGTTLYRLKRLLLILSCLAAAAIIGLIAVAVTDRIPGGVVVVMIIVGSYGIIKTLMEASVLKSQLPMMLLAAIIFSVACPIGFYGGEYIMGTLSGASAAAALWLLYVYRKEDRRDVRRSRSWMQKWGEYATIPYPLSSLDLAEHLRALAKEHQDTMSISRRGKIFCYEELTLENDEEDQLVSFTLHRSKDTWSAVFYDYQVSEQFPSLEPYCVRDLFIRETGGIEPACMEFSVLAPVQGVLFCRNGELHLYPARIRTEFMNRWYGMLFPTRTKD